MLRKQVSIIKELSSRIEKLATQNAQLQHELEQEQIQNHHFWQHIIWLHLYGDETTGAGPCPFCGSHHLGLKDDDSRSKWFVVCKCKAQGPACDTELGAIEAWNKVAKSDCLPQVVHESR